MGATGNAGWHVGGYCGREGWINGLNDCSGFLGGGIEGYGEDMRLIILLNIYYYFYITLRIAKID